MNAELKNIDNEIMKHFKKRVEGAVLGLVVGDALGVPVEFIKRSELLKDPVREMRSGGVHGQIAGTWSDDSSMVLCTMDSLIEKGIDYNDLMERFANWLWSAENTAHGSVFDVGGTCRNAIFSYTKGTPPMECGEKADYTCGNGSLMRILPIALYIIGHYKTQKYDDRAAQLIHEYSMCTHAHLRCLMACGIYASVLIRLYHNGLQIAEDVRVGVLEALDYYRDKSEFSEVYNEFESLENIADWRESQISSTGYVMHTLQAALWCLSTTESYAECVLKAVNLGDDADTTAAVAGGLAGFCYGEKSIPKEWAETTAKYDEIKERCKSFLQSIRV